MMENTNVTIWTFDRSCFKWLYFCFQIMTETHKTPLIKASCHAQNRLSDLENLSMGLEKCQKSLNDYLDSKRNAFPRFFFISDDELLSILGSSDPSCVQEHMIKVM
jgi:dynein heavy chain